jgi:hypothetical protein
MEDAVWTWKSIAKQGDSCMKTLFLRTSGKSFLCMLALVAAVPVVVNAQSHDPIAHWQLADEQQFF